MKKASTKKDDIDLCSCYFPEEEIPDEFTEEDSLEHRKGTAANMYLIAEDFTLLLMGDNSIKVTEHFKDSGKEMNALLEEQIRYDKNKM